MEELDDTIAAIATARGGGIGVVRISGPRAAEILGKVFRPWPRSAPSHKLHHGHVHDPDTGEAIDEVLACLMRAPRSYTGQDVAELHGHGGQVVLELVLGAVLRSGARLAGAGEFTRRAYFAGKLDLAQAESIAQLVAASTEREVRVANAVRAGALSREIEQARHKIVDALAELDGAIDFPEEGLEVATEVEVGARMAELAGALGRLADTHRSGRLLAHRPLVVVAGCVNAGKSTLFNRLVGHERALVDSAAGTTRDVVEAEVELAGLKVRLADTAGERDQRHDGELKLESRGIELGRKQRELADLVVQVVDGEVGFGDVDRKLWGELDPGRRLLVWNKADRAAPSGLAEDLVPVVVSAVHGEGVEALARAIGRALGDRPDEQGVIVVGARHEAALRRAQAALGQGAGQLGRNEPAELAAIALREALGALGQISGETADDAVIDAIFSRFCIGK